MIKICIAFTIGSILLFLSILHIYWALGGKWAIEKTIPERYKGVFHSEQNQVRVILATVFVAIGLSVLGLLVFSHAGIIKSLLSPLVMRYLLIAAGIVFLLRVVGDFTSVGIFKSDKNGEFAYWDSVLYVPLCLFLSLGFCGLVFL